MRLKICLFLLLFSSSAFADSGERIYESDGNFSFRPPSGWQVTGLPDLQYKVAFTPAGNYIAAIYIFDEIFNGDLKSFVDSKLSPSDVLLSREQFTTNSGISGECIVINDFQNSLFVRNIFYCLTAGKNTFLLILCTVPDDVSETYIPLFEESIKTFELLN